MPTNVYYSVGQNASDHKTGSPLISMFGGVMNFNIAQTHDQLGVGDRVTYDTNKIAYLVSKNNSTSWNVVTATGGIPADAVEPGVVSIAHEYTSLSAAESGASDANHLNTTDLVSGDYVLNLACYNDSGPDTTQVTVEGWTTDATRYVNIFSPFDSIQCNSRQRHVGVLGSGYQLKNSTSGHTFILNDANTVVDGLETVLDNSNDFPKTIRVEGDNCVVLGCIIETDEAGRSGIFTKDEITLYIINCLFLSCPSAGLSVQLTNPRTINVFVYNCTFFDCGGYSESIRKDGGIAVGADDSSAVINIKVKNTLSMSISSTVDFREIAYSTPGTVNWSGNNNIASDTSTTGKFTSSFNSRTATANKTPGVGDWVVFNNISAPVYDTHLQQSLENDAEGGGADLSSDSDYSFSDDYEGEKRFSPWDIGADEISAGRYRNYPSGVARGVCRGVA